MIVSSEDKDTPYDFSTEMKTRLDDDTNKTPPEASTSPNGGSLALRTLWISMAVMVTLEILCLPRFLFMPLAIVGALGPVFLGLPFAVYLCVNLLLDLVFLTARNDNMPSAFSCCRWMQAISPSNHDSLKAFITIRAGILSTMLWSAIDIFISVYAALVCQGLIEAFAMEPDDTITLGRETFHLYLTISFYLFCISASVRGAAFVMGPIYLMLSSKMCGGDNFLKLPKFICDCSDSNKRHCVICCIDQAGLRVDVDVAIDIPESFHYYRGFIAWFALFLFILSMGGVSYTTHDILSVLYYRSEDAAAYEDCEPNSQKNACFLPFPSSFWEVDSTTTATGRSIDMRSQSRPFTRQEEYSSFLLQDQDGFPVGSMILWDLPGVDGTGFISTHHIEESVLLNSTTLLINLDTLQFVPHFTEIDRLEENLKHKISYTQPAEVLEFASHYALVVQSLTTASGQLIQPSDATWAYIYTYVNNGSMPGGNFDIYFEDVYGSHYEHMITNVYPVLESMGIGLENSLLVLDFHTASESGVLGDIRAMKDLSTARIDYELALPSSDIQDFYSIPKSRKWGCSASYDNQTDDIYTLRSSYYFSVSVPWFLNEASHESNMNDKLLDLNDTYLTDVDSILDIPLQKSGIGLLVRVPCSVASGYSPVNGIMYYGHGALGSREDMERKSVIELANRNGFIVVAMDWRGLCMKDVLVLGRGLLYDSSVLKAISANILQGFVGNDAVMHILSEILTQERDALGIPASVVIGSLPKVYYGYSLGGMFGSGFSAFHGEFSRSLIGIPGSPMSFVIGRSSDFAGFSALARFQFFNSYQLRFFALALQQALEPAESAGYARTSSYNNNILLIQVALGDSQVSSPSSAIMSRQLNCQVLDPSPTSPPYNYGLPHDQSPLMLTAGNCRVMIHDFEYENAKIDTESSEIPIETHPHECMGTLPVVFEQAVKFLNILGNATAPAFVNSACGVDYCTEEEEVTCEHIFVRT